MNVKIPEETPRGLLSDGIRRAADATGLSRSELARRCGIAPATLAHWIAGLSTPTEARLTRFARHCGVSVENLRDGLPNLYERDEG